MVVQTFPPYANMNSSNQSRFTNAGTDHVNQEGHSLADSSVPGAYPASSTSTPLHTSSSTPLHTSSNAQNTSTIPDRTRGVDNTTSSHDNSHVGRDAALAGGAAGLAGAT